MAKTKPEEVEAALPLPDGIGSEYAEIERGPIEKWDDHIGELVKGVALSIRPAGKGNVLELRQGEKVVTYGCPKILESLVRNLLGREVALLCNGKTVDTPNGTAWGFRVFAKSGGDQPF